MRSKITPRVISGIQTIFFDVDGTLTDGRLFFDHEGREMKVFNARDGSRMTMALRSGIKIYFITGRISPAVTSRAVDRKINGVLSKKELIGGGFRAFCSSHEIDLAHALYLGDDINDLHFMLQVGFPIAVKNAAQEVKSISRFVTNARGGEGAAAELIEKILKARGLWNKLIEDVSRG